jgi:hypothetical protein
LEILAENTLWFEHIASIIISLGIAALTWSIVIGCFVKVVSDGFEPIDLTVLLFLFIAIVATLGVIYGIKVGPEKQYEAIVTDYNEVYENGYEVVDKRGEIVILREAK